MLHHGIRRYFDSNSSCDIKPVMLSLHLFMCTPEFLDWCLRSNQNTKIRTHKNGIQILHFFKFFTRVCLFFHIFQFCSLSNYVYIGSHVWVRNSIFHRNYFRYTTTIWDVFLCVLSCSAKQCLPFRYNFPICSLHFCTFLPILPSRFEGMWILAKLFSLAFSI